MIYDMRIYDLQPGSVPQYMKAVEEVAIKIRDDYGVKLAGWYYHRHRSPEPHRPHLGVPGLHAFREARDQVRSDPRWNNEYMPRVRGLAVRQQDMIMKGADFFPGPQ